MIQIFFSLFNCRKLKVVRNQELKYSPILAMYFRLSNKTVILSFLTYLYFMLEFHVIEFMILKQCIHVRSGVENPGSVKCLMMLFICLIWLFMAEVKTSLVEFLTVFILGLGFQLHVVYLVLVLSVLLVDFVLLI